MNSGKIFILAAICLSAVLTTGGHGDIHRASDEDIFGQFQSFLEKYSKKYTTIEEFKLRFENFKNNFQQVELHWMHAARTGEADYEMGITQFFDMTPMEFAKQYLTLNVSTIQHIKASANRALPHYKNGNAPDAFNWVDQGKVTKVKNQGQCGSCWAFSAIGNLESINAIKYNKLVEFSEQQLVDCDQVDQGCNGGLMENAFDYFEKSNIMLESDYTYHARGGKCQYNASKAVAKVTGYNFSPEDEGQVKQFLYENGALSVAMNATFLQFYMGGIYKPWFSWTCNPKSLNHGVLLVGYGVEKDKEYWIVKNSWGASWGEKGYFRIIRGTGACGINTHVLSAKIEDI